MTTHDEIAEEGLMKKQLHVMAAIVAGALLLPSAPATACCVAEAAVLSSSNGGPWIELHRPDGEVVHIKIEHIVFVMSAVNSGADRRAQSKLQLVNGFCDVRENVTEVMRLIRGDAALG
jgi:hypothetical protein